MNKINLTVPDCIRTLHVTSSVPDNVNVLAVCARFDVNSSHSSNTDNTNFAAKTIEAHGFFDTGSTASFITPELASRLKAVTSKSQPFIGLGGLDKCPRCDVNFSLQPYEASFPSHNFLVSSVAGDYDFLIGMDIISLGDFSITTYFNAKVIELTIHRPIYFTNETTISKASRRARPSL